MSDDCHRLALPDVNDGLLWAGDTSAELPRKSFNFTNFVWVVIVLDCVVISVITVALVGAGGQVTGARVPAAVLFMLMVFALFAGNNLFKIEVIEDFSRAWPRIVMAWVAAGAVITVIALFIPSKLPADTRGWIACYAIGLGVVMAERLGVAWLFRRWVRRGNIIHSIAIIGDADLAIKFSSRFLNNQFGVRVSAVFNDQDADGNVVDRLVNYEKMHRIDTVVIVLPIDDCERLRKMVRRLSLLPTNIRILPGELALKLKAKRFAPLGEIPGVQLMTIADRPIDNWGVIAKFTLDRFVALLALLFFGPLMLICALVIKFSSPGPVLYRQERIGYRNEIFTVYKFRSMHINACDTGKLTEQNDTRIFKFGRIMRKLSLDELPQIFNVLKGDMSLVGPRPHMPEARAAGKFYFDAVSAYALRHRVKPGITGWAQVCGWRGPTETIEQIENRVAHDLFYIDNWSLGFDLFILLKTIFVGFFGKNAF